MHHHQRETRILIHRLENCQILLVKTRHWFHPILVCVALNWIKDLLDYLPIVKDEQISGTHMDDHFVLHIFTHSHDKFVLQYYRLILLVLDGEIKVVILFI